LALVGNWDRGPMTFSLTAGANLEIAESRTASFSVAARGGKDGINIEALRATEGEVAVVNAVGHLPITFAPAGKPLMHIDTNGPLRLDATVAPNSAFWQKLAAASGVELKDPQASAHLTGTWQRPEGNASVKATRIAIDPKRVTGPLPEIEALNVQVTADRSGVTLQQFTFNVEGQAVRAQGRLPVPDGNWGQLFKQPLAAAERGADLRLEVPDADVAVFTRFLPAVLAPKGRLQADVHYKSGGFEGFLKLRDAASRPLGPLGVLQEVNADIALAGRKLALRGVTARSGGQPITLSGTIELPEKGEPRFDLTLKGENLPFVRQTGLLLRGDLDLKLQSLAGSQPRLSGNVRLRDSLFLSDVRAFLPKGGGASPTRRPPYFAIETAPVNTWALAVEVTGEQFMRMRTPVFAGVASARFRLGGTLGEPRAIGEVTIDEGKVRMPFASFEVMQAAVRLSEADPYEPAIYLRATGRRYGYDLAMEIEGNASQPNVVFTSSPALDTEQVLLMVMTGAAPSNEITNSATQRIASLGYFLGSTLFGSLGSDAADPDRLTIASGEKISRQGKETYDIEYKLSDRWTVTAERNEFDEYNAGVKWRVFRGKTGAEKTTEHAKK
jgi:translocation and assembly module TamB